MSGSMIGRTFSGRYRIVERIGIGGMAEVYRAQDTVLGRIVAIKVMLPQYAADADFTQRFRHEAAAAANLQSPYIVNVYDWGQDEGTYYIVMEYVRGGDLKTAIRERGSISQRKVAEIASQACQALSVAHGQDIVHRDVKPQNIMVQPDGNVKVMDFGIARAKNSVKTQTSSVLGTAHYISPEQAQGKDLTAASDIYSLGVCMYEAITGQLPFDGPDAISVAMKQVNEQPKPLHEILPSVEPVLEAIVLRAMQKEPVKRFPTALDMRRSLNDFLAGRARGEAAAAAILSGSPVAAVPAVSPHAADATRQMHPNANLQTHVIGGVVPRTNTQVMPTAVAPMPPNAWNGQTSAIPNTGMPVQFREEKPPKKGHGKTAVIVLLVLAVLAGAAFAGYNMMTTKPNTVPNLAGKTLEEAEKALVDAGYSIGDTDEIFSDSVKSGVVISTDPSAGTEAEPETRVSLLVSKGIEKIKVPDLVGLEEDNAKETLANVGLNGRKEKTEYSDNVEKGCIISISPKAGQEVEKGAEVAYVVSKGQEKIEIPWVVGYTQDYATEMLKDEGFKVTYTEDYSDDVDEGLVMWQDPAGEEKAKKGTKITICVSLGERMVEVPDVIGLPISDARAILETAGFKVSETGDYSGSATVISQSTAGEAREGATINITAEEPKTSSKDSSSKDSPSKSSSSSENDDNDDEEDDEDTE